MDTFNGIYIKNKKVDNFGRKYNSLQEKRDLLAGDYF